jgi:hypothetical protein
LFPFFGECGDVAFTEAHRGGDKWGDEDRWGTGGTALDWKGVKQQHFFDDAGPILVGEVFSE